MNKKYTGFTLIELLVVIAIISLLSSIVITSLNSAKAKGRDALRVSQLKELQKSLDLYFDKHGTYPPCGESSSDSWCGRCESTGYDTYFKPTLTPLVNEGFIKTVPKDPQNYGNGGTSCYSYEYYSYPDGSGSDWECGSISVRNYKYVIRFATESNKNLGLPKFSLKRGTGSEYCLLGDKI